MKVSVDNLGAVGMLFDRKPYEIPPEAWSSLLNVRCFDRSMWSTFGHASIMGVPIIQPFFLQSVIDNTGTPLWAYPGLAAVAATDGTTHADITRTVGGAYGGNSGNLWNGGNFGGITILNNGVDVPQAWIVPSLGTKLVNLANWPASTTAKIVRVFGRFLIAMDVTASGTRKAQLVKWSDEADIGTVPVTWDPADTTKKAGEWPLLETDGAIIDGGQLGDRFYVYKEDSVHVMTRIGGRFVFQFNKAFGNEVSILAQRCFAEYNKRHIVVTPEDIIIHDGANYESLLDDKMLRWWLGRVDVANAFRSFIAMNYAENEAWVCIPESGNTYPNIAMIINMKDATITLRDLPAPAHIDYGKPTTGVGSTYDVQDTAFDQMVGYFGQDQSTANRKRMVAVVPEAERNMFLQSEDLTTTWSGNLVTTQANVEGTADGLRPTAASGTHYVSQTYAKLAAAAQTWTVRSKLKADGYNYGVLHVGDGAGTFAEASFDLTNGTLIGTTVSGTGPVVIAAGVVGAADALGYYECYLTATTNAGANALGLIGVNQANTIGRQTYTGDAVSRIRVKESYFRRGAYGSYQATTTLAALGAFFLMDSGFDFDGVAFTAIAERQGLAIIGQTRAGEPKSDIDRKKFIKEIWPKCEIANGTVIPFYVGRQDRVVEGVTWEGPFNFSPTTDLMINPLLECRLFGLKIVTSNREQWRIDGYDVDVVDLGVL